MANLTLSIDSEILRKARIRALEQGTSVNALVREYVETLDIAADGGSGSGGRSWTREKLYEERLGGRRYS